jgi:glutamate 5-kinase
MNTASKGHNGAAHRLVVKLGTSLLTGGTSYLNMDIMTSLVAQMAELRRQGAELVIVSSGAVAAGRAKLGLQKKIPGVPLKQMLAAVGQSRLMYTYEQLFGKYDITIAQTLLTKADLSDRSGYLNTRNTLLALLDLGVITIVNENDVVAEDEIREAKFGDNDSLSAMVANLIDADLLLILSDTSGLYTADPHLDPNAKLIQVVEKIDSKIEKLAGGSAGKLGVGGMITKVEAAKLSTASGVTTIIADGKVKDVALRVYAGEAIGTRFQPTSSKRESRERWMLSGLSTKGKIYVDAGCAAAVIGQNRSLLAAGISRIEGNFKRGDIVNIYDSEGNRIAAGITNYSAADIKTIEGVKSSEIAALLSYDYGPEVVHRNNLVVL